MSENWTDAPNPQRIDIDREDDCRYWSEAFGVSVDELKQAVAHAGEDPQEVKQYLAQGPGNTDPNGASHWRATSGL